MSCMLSLHTRIYTRIYTHIHHWLDTMVTGSLTNNTCYT